MLIQEKTKPSKLAIDAPSKKFLQFMKKHYNLYKYTPQNCNFVFFEEYFDQQFNQQTGSN